MGLGQLIPARPKRMAKRLLGLELAYAPQVRIAYDMHGAGDGQWCACPGELNASSIVYSFGVGLDISFDRSIIESFGLNVYAFDPTPKSVQWLATQSLPKGFHFQPVGAADFDGVARFAPPVDPRFVSHTMLDRPQTAAQAIEVPVRRIATIMAQWEHPRIDLLKLDIEGAEYSVIDDMLACDIRPAQLLVEFHHRFPGVGLPRTRRAVRALHRAGYRLFYVSPSQMEFGFILTDRRSTR